VACAAKGARAQNHVNVSAARGRVNSAETGAETGLLLLVGLLLA
jgi:hypothetical protein